MGWVVLPYRVYFWGYGVGIRPPVLPRVLPPSLGSRLGVPIPLYPITEGWRPPGHGPTSPSGVCRVDPSRRDPKKNPPRPCPSWA